MAGAGLSSAEGPGNTDAVQAYLARVAAGLIGPKPVRAAILDEVEDGLHEAVASHLLRGVPPKAAAATAIAEFGDPRTVAAGFRVELATASARRVGLRLLLTGPLVGLTWVAMLAVGIPWAGRQPPAGLGLAVAVFAGVLTVAVPAAVCSVLIAGRLSRWLPASSRAAPTAASLAAMACVAGDTALLGWLLPAALFEGLAVWPLASVPVMASLARLVLAGFAARRCLAARALLTRP